MIDDATGHFVHPRHVSIFLEAAEVHGCHILVRETGPAAIHWIGKEGYTGKRVDLKAKTAKKDVGKWQLAGLVCSPEIHPGAFAGRDMKKVFKEWNKAQELITMPSDRQGFDDYSRINVPTPYIVQTNPGHKHYGCVAMVEFGLVSPKYVHGDYDLFAILPIGNRYNAMTDVRVHRVGGIMTHPSQTLQDRLQQGQDDYIGPLTFKVANFINTKIAGGSPSISNALMVNHGEEINFSGTFSDERVCAFFGKNHGGYYTRVLSGAGEQQAFFQRVRRGD
ncbi:MAG: hypothetical protein AB3X44_15510 [Leptothrix sp. (in: b-proteobacteria)]